MRHVFTRFAVATFLALSLFLGGCAEDKGLKVKGMSRNQGSFYGGEVVTIFGNGFEAAGKDVAVYFGNSRAKVLQIDGDHELKVEVPGGEVGDEVEVTLVFGGAGEAKLPTKWTYIDPEQRKLSVDDLTTDE